MRNKTLSKLLHLSVILTFFLPFFYTGCGISAKEKMVREKAIMDSITNKNAKNNVDSLKAKEIENTINIESEIQDNRLVNRLVNNHQFLSFFLMPKEETYTGLGMVINAFPSNWYFPLVISFVLLIIGLLLKFIYLKSNKLFIVIDLLVLTGIIISPRLTWNVKILWGYWLCLVLTIGLVIYDIYRMKQTKR